MTEILFVHGALVRDGAWWWHPVADRVERASGVRSRAVALPSCGEAEDTEGRTGLAADAAALQRALDDADGVALVVGHSYGGTVIAEGADHPAARHLLHLSSYLPEVGSTQGGVMSGEPDPVAVAPAGGDRVALSGYDEGTFSARFLQDVDDPEVRGAAWARVTEQAVGAFTEPTSRAAWRGRPSTYLVCTDDRSTTVALQREHAARATRVVDLASGHHPFLSRPDAVSAEVLRILDAIG